MARLITKFKYLKPDERNHFGGYAEYIATREGVEKIDESKRNAPATNKQKQLIKKILSDFPDSRSSLEYEDYLKEKTVGAASEFITRALEENADEMMHTTTYADYIATRPRAERFGSHGLFTDDGVAVDLQKVSDELNAHTGIANILNDEGVRRQYGREKWHHTTVNYVLNNERYKGDALLQKQITTQTLPFKKQRNHGEQPMYYVENSNPAIVSRETYEAVQALIKSRQPSCKRKAKTYPLTRMLLCPDCGHTFRRQVVNGTAYWLCAAKATNKTDCAWRRVKEDEVYATFNLMIRKVQANREYLLGTLIRQLEELQYRTTGSQQRIKEIDREIADLTAQNLVLSRLHGKGVLNAADYTAQSDVLENKITELRIERRTKITDSDENEMLEELKMLNDILKEVEIGIDFDAELFEQTVDSITVESNERLTFHLAGGICLPEKIREKGRCYRQ